MDSAGLGSADLGSAGLGSSGLGSAGLDSAGLGSSADFDGRNRLETNAFRPHCSLIR